jgi:hypothetical protein
LNPELDPEWEQEQDFIETTGIKRVVQAMHAHLWPNLQMKGKEMFGLHVYYITCMQLCTDGIILLGVLKNELTETLFYCLLMLHHAYGAYK